MSKKWFSLRSQVLGYRKNSDLVLIRYSMVGNDFIKWLLLGFEHNNVHHGKTFQKWLSDFGT